MKVTIAKRLFILTLLIGSHYCLFGQVQRLNYDFHKQDSLSLLVTVSFKMNESGKIKIHLPSEWAGQRTLYQAISQLKSKQNIESIDTTSKPDEYIVNSKPNMLVALSYLLKQDWTGPLKYPQYYRPVTRKGIFYFEGYSGLLYPDMPDSAKMKCTISYSGFGEKDFTGCSFFAGNRKKTFTTTLSDLLNSFYCAGAYESRSIEKNGRAITMAVAGKFLFSSEAVFDGISKIISTERNFWKSKGSKYFFVALLQMDDRQNNGGTAHYQSFALFQSPDLALDEGFLPLVSHEYFHNWLGEEIKMPKPSETFKWFSEGFTEYYSLKLCYKAGLITSSSLLKKLNDQIKKYYLSSFFDKANEEIAGKYWTDSQIRSLSYVRGLTIAFWLDCKMSAAKDSGLDDLMRDIGEAQKEGQVFSKGAFDQAILKHADSFTLSVVDAANQGNNEALTQELYKLKSLKATDVIVDKVFDLGFDLQASRAAKRIVGLKSESNAAKAGLKENMKLTGEFSIYNDNPEKAAKVRTLQNGQKVMVEYMPARSVEIHIPQFLSAPTN